MNFTESLFNHAVLTTVPISDLKDMKEGDHIMTGTQHYLVASIDTEQNKFTAYTCENGKVVKEERTFKAPWNFCVSYEGLLSSQEAITNAEKEIEQGAVWTNSVRFVTK